MDCGSIHESCIAVATLENYNGRCFDCRFLGSFETNVFEIAPGQYVHENHVYKMGDRETLCWAAEAGVLLEDTGRPGSLDQA